MASESDSTNIRQRAVAMRDQVLAEARRWDEFIRMLDNLAAAPELNSTKAASGAAMFVGEGKMALASAHVVGMNSAPHHTRPGRMAETENLARQIIMEFGRPLPTREMLMEMSKRGHEVGGKEPASTLSARLSRSTSLENFSPYGWRLKQPRQDIGAAGPSAHEEPAASDPETHSDPVEPVVGGGT